VLRVEDKKQTTNQPTVEPQASAFPSTPTDPNVIKQSDPPAEMSTSPKMNSTIWLIGGLVLLALILVGAYFYLGQTKTAQPIPTPKAAQNQLEEMGNELNSLNVESEGNDFDPVDKDLQTL